MTTWKPQIVIELGPKAEIALRRQQVKEPELNQTTIINRALQVYDAVKELIDKGETVYSIAPDGTTTRIAFVIGTTK